MRKLVLLLLAAAPALAAQSIVTVPAQQCVWRAGDDPAWAAPSLDDSAWLPLPSWQLNPSLTRLWVRCRIDSASFANLNDPALEIATIQDSDFFVSEPSPVDQIRDLADHIQRFTFLV